MKRNWEYKKLGDVCTIERGGSPRPIEKFITDDPNGLNWIKIGDAVDGSKFITSTKEKIKPEGLKKTRLVHKGDFILSNSMSFGRPYILDIDGCIHDGWLVIHDENKVFDKIYLYYLLSSPNMYSEFKRLAVGGVVNNLNSQLVRNVSVAIPPLSEQSRIVAELDLLTGIIDKQNAQLKELDNLAQSIFYDMFGDPIENPKRWEVKNIGDIADVKIGPFGSLLHASDYINGGHPVINPVHLKAGKIIAEDDFTVNDDMYAQMMSYVLRENDIVFGRRGDIGRCALVAKEQVGYLCGTGSLFVRFNIQVQPLFSIAALMHKSITEFLLKKAKGATMLNINCGIVEDIPFILPPLALQQSFAEKIKSIEKQKEAIRASIADMQKLLDYTMDKYFG